MKRLTQLLIVALAAAGLTLVACESDETPVEQETTAEVPQAVEEPAEAAEEEQEEEAEEEAAREHSEDTFILAAFEVTCVNAQIEDPARAGEIKEEIYARYGFEGQEDFQSAEGQFGELETVKLAIETRMERCTPEVAAGLAEAGFDPSAEAEEETAEAEEETAEAAPRAAAPPRPTPARTGSLSGELSGGDFSGATISLQVRNDFNVRGQFRGEREGRAFMIPFNGTVSENGQITATGERGGHSVNLTGRLTANGATGEVTGQVHQRDYRLRYRAN